MPYVRAKEPFAVELDGYNQVISPETIMRDSDPTVKKYPDRFEPAEVVEDATANPGEKRGQRR